MLRGYDVYIVIKFKHTKHMSVRLLAILPFQTRMIGDMATSETLVCFLCNGIVAYKDRNPSKFNR